MKKIKKEKTLKKRHINVINNIEQLLEKNVKEYGDFGKSKVIESDALVCALRALQHLKCME